jgi:phosphotransacetylase
MKKVKSIGTGKYEQLMATCRKLSPVTAALAHPCAESALAAAVEAAQAGLIVPILVGPADKLKQLARRLKLDLEPYASVDVPHSHAAAVKAVELVREGAAEILMKGSLHTDEFLAAIVARETGLRTGRRLSHVFLMDVPNYHKVFMITDAAINIAPGLEEKADILQNAIDLAMVLGVAQPKVAILSAVETVTSKIPSTIEAAALCKMAERGQIRGARVDGPLAFDNAISKAAAKIKGIVSAALAGDCLRAQFKRRTAAGGGPSRGAWRRGLFPASAGRCGSVRSARTVDTPCAAASAAQSGGDKGAA